MKDIVSFNDFTKLDIRVGTILSCSVVEGSEKLVNLKVDLGFEIGERQIVAGISKWYECNELVGKQVLFVVNLEPRKIMGLESQGMLLALGASEDNKPILIVPDEKIENGESAS